MLYQNYYAHFSCYLPLIKPGLKHLYICSYINTGRPLIHVSSLYRIQWTMCISLHMRTETDLAFETLFSLPYFRITNNGLGSKAQ
jgi:hypothetical protein